MATDPDFELENRRSEERRARLQERLDGAGRDLQAFTERLARDAREREERWRQLDQERDEREARRASEPDPLRESIERMIAKSDRDKAAVSEILAREGRVLGRVKALLAYHRENDRRADAIVDAFLMELAELVLEIEDRLTRFEERQRAGDSSLWR